MLLDAREQGEERSGDRIIHHVRIKHDLPARGVAGLRCS
jgi:hypothetical protein